jgi:hypothetical protein
VSGVVICRRAATAERFVGGSVYAEAVLADSPVSYWRLGESSGTVAVDEMGTNVGTYVGSITLGQTGALVGDADTSVLFNPADSEITVADHASLDVGDVFSLECWVNRDSVAGTPGGLFMKGFTGFELHDLGSGTIRFDKSGVTAIVRRRAGITSWRQRTGQQ